MNNFADHEKLVFVNTFPLKTRHNIPVRRTLRNFPSSLRTVVRMGQLGELRGASLAVPILQFFFNIVQRGGGEGGQTNVEKKLQNS